MQYTLLMRAAARCLRGGAPDHFGAESRLIKPRPCPVAFAPPAGAAAMPETIDSALRQARAPLAPGQAELLLAHVLGRHQARPYAHGLATQSPDAEYISEALVVRHAAH